MKTLLEIQGVLDETLPKVFRDQLPVILAQHRNSQIQLMVTTLVESTEEEWRRRANFLYPARGDEPPQFTWKGTGSCDAVTRRFRLEFLRQLGPADMKCEIFFSMKLMENEASRPAESPRAERSAGGPDSGLSAVPRPPAHEAAPASTRRPVSGPVPVSNDESEEADAVPAGGRSARIIDAAIPHFERERLEAEAAAAESPAEPEKASAPAEAFAGPSQQASAIPAKPSAPAPRGGAALPGNLYVDWFGFERMPFNNTPDPRFFFPTEKHQEALSRLIYAISERKGFVLISGEIGSGKSTLCRTLLSQLPGTVKTALITHTHVDSEQLVRAIAEDLDLPVAGKSKMEVLQAINHYLVEQLAAGATVVILIDEAQHLSPAALEEVRMISNLETEEEKLVQLILLGQPELRDKIRLPQMLQLRQRIAVQYHLMPLTRSETIAYIQHRLRVAAASEKLDFKRGAMAEVYRHTGGTPRLINILCDNALLTAYTRERRTITSRLIREAAKDLDLHASGGGIRAFFAAW